MLKTKYCLYLVLFFFCVVFTGAGGHSARAELSVAVVDMQLLQTKSDAAQSIETQLEARREALQKEFAGYEQELREAEKNLVEKRESMAPEEFAKQRKEFEQKLMTTRQLVQQRRRDLETAVAAASKTLNDRIFEIVAGETEKNGYQLVLTRQNVVLVEKSIDITQTVLTSLNEGLKSVKLEAK